MIQPGARNSEFLDLDDDSLYHLGLKKSPELLNQLQEMFGGVKYVCMGGSPDRAMTFGNKAAEELGISTPEGGVQTIGKTESCNMCQVGPILSISMESVCYHSQSFFMKSQNYWNMQVVPMLNSSELVHRVV